MHNIFHKIVQNRFWSLAVGIHQQEALGSPIPRPPAELKQKPLTRLSMTHLDNLILANIQQGPTGRLQIGFIAISLHSSQKLFEK